MINFLSKKKKHAHSFLSTWLRWKEMCVSFSPILWAKKQVIRIKDFAKKTLTFDLLSLAFGIKTEIIWIHGILWNNCVVSVSFAYKKVRRPFCKLTGVISISLHHAEIVRRPYLILSIFFQKCMLFFFPFSRSQKSMRFWKTLIKSAMVSSRSQPNSGSKFHQLTCRMAFWLFCTQTIQIRRNFFHRILWNQIISVFIPKTGDNKSKVKVFFAKSLILITYFLAH